MKFITISPTDFADYAAKSPYKSFMQTPEIAKYREANGWTAYYLGVTESDELKAATMLVAKPTFLGKSTFLAPGGPLLDLEDAKLTAFLLTHLKRYVKSHNGYVLHLDPYYELTERDRDGNPIPNGFNRTKAEHNLQKLGFKPAPTTGQPRYSFAIDLAGRTPDEILADFKRNTRGHIRKAEKAGVTVRELKREELNILKQITSSTAARRDFTDKPLSYYEQMYDLFHDRGEVMFMVAEAELEDASFEGDPEAGKPRTSAKTPVATGVLDAPREGSVSSSHMVPLSAAMFMLYGDEVIYLFSGSEERYMKEYNAQYAIQWHMIKYAAEHEFKRYNFYGISGLPHNGELDGIYEFKKGFSSGQYGHVIELIGAYELSTNAPFYHLHHLISKLKHH